MAVQCTDTTAALVNIGKNIPGKNHPGKNHPSEIHPVITLYNYEKVNFSSVVCLSQADTICEGKWS